MKDQDSTSTISMAKMKERGNPDHVTSPWGEECWVITSKIAEF